MQELFTSKNTGGKPVAARARGLLEAARRGPGKAGSALVIVLVFLMMLMVLVLVFLGTMRDAQQTFAWRHHFSSNTRLGDYASTLIINGLREEMRLLSDVSTTATGDPWLEPVFPEDRRPRRLLPVALDEAAGLEALLRVSHPDPALAMPGGLIAGSATLDSGVLPGSGVSERMLHKPVLLDPAADFLPGDVHWILLTRAGPVAPGTLEPKHRMGSGAPEEVIGRVAFVIYDLSGKLDVNATGTGTVGTGFAASGARPSPETLASRKGSLRFLRATEVAGLRGAGFDGTATVPTAFGYELPRLLVSPVPAGGMRGSSRGELLASPGADYGDWVAGHYGLLRDAGAPGIVSRQDLLRQAEEPATRVDPAGLARLSTFSRAAAVVEQVPGATPFPLRALDMPAFNFPADSADDPERQALIRRYFGLARASDGEPWQYVEQTSSEPGEVFQSWDEITDRPPNFFETLKAALEPGSLGQFTRKTAAGENVAWDEIADLQILKIGANLIDQWDRDNYPTLLELRHNTLPEPVARVAGLENLPLVHQLHLDALNPLWGAANGEVPVRERRVLPYLIPELWNPHKPAVGAGAMPGPQSIRLRLLGSTEIGLRSGAAITPGASRDEPNSLVARHAGNGSLVIDAAEFPKFGPVPRVIRSAQASGIFDNSGLTWKGQALPGLSSSQGRLPGTGFYAARLTRDPASRDVHDACLSAAPLPEEYHALGRSPGVERELFGFHPGLYPNPPYRGMQRGRSGTIPTWEWAEDFGDRKLLEVNLKSPHRMDVLLEFQDHRGEWQPYNRFAHQNLAGTGGGIGLAGDRRDSTVSLFDGALLNCEPDHPLIRRYLDTGGAITFLKADPRTPRLGVAYTTNRFRGELPVVASAGAGLLEGGGHRRQDEPVDPAELLYQQPGGQELRLGVKARVPGAEDPVDAGRDMLESTTDGPPVFAHLFDHYYPAALAQNAAPPQGSDPATFARDPDGTTRPADGLLPRQSASGPSDGNPAPATPPDPARNSVYTNQSAFPVILNRPFQSIAELGHVFRDQPWKTLDLIGSTSADHALLDWFTLEETVTAPDGHPPVRGGVLDLAVAGPDIPRAMLLGTAQVPAEVTFHYPTSPLRDQRPENVITNRAERSLDAVLLDRAVAEQMAGTLKNRLGLEPDLAPTRAFAAIYPPLPGEPPAPAAQSAGTPGNRGRVGPGHAPLSEGARTRDESAEFPDFTGGSPQANPAIKAQREAALNALADVAQSNTWNLFIDLYVQTGGYSPQATAWAEFTIRSRSRAWHRVAIHRHTARVLEHQRERVR